MRFKVLFICVLLGIGCVACTGVSVRPVYEYFDVDREFDGKVLNSHPIWGPIGYVDADFDREVKSSRWGVELAYPVYLNIECFVDVNYVKAEYFDYNQSYYFNESFDSRDVDGEEVGIGVRSLWSHDPGWGLDWGVRLKYQELDDTNTVYIYTDELEIKSYGFDLNIGPYYTIPLDKDLFLSPQSGLLFKAERGTMKQERGFWNMADLDYDQSNVALYLGFRLNAENLKNLTLLVNGYTGNDSLQGFLLSLGCRF